MSLDELHGLCRRRGFRLAVELVDPTGRTLGDEPYPGAALRVRVLTRDGHVLAGRIQSPEGEPVERLAELVLGTLQRKGLIV